MRSSEPSSLGIMVVDFVATNARAMPDGSSLRDGAFRTPKKIESMRAEKGGKKEKQKTIPKPR
jgi:hypothetical protein